MAKIIIQQNLFNWKEIAAATDLERLELVLEAIPDEELMRKLEAARKGRRDDNPVRAMWNSLLAAIVFGHESIASLRRELLRNPAMLELCGFDVLKGKAAVPSEHACLDKTSTSSEKLSRVARRGLQAFSEKAHYVPSRY